MPRQTYIPKISNDIVSFEMLMTHPGPARGSSQRYLYRFYGSFLPGSGSYVDVLKEPFEKAAYVVRFNDGITACNCPGSAHRMKCKHADLVAMVINLWPECLQAYERNDREPVGVDLHPPV